MPVSAFSSGVDDPKPFVRIDQGFGGGFSSPAANVVTVFGLMCWRRTSGAEVPDVEWKVPDELSSIKNWRDVHSVVEVFF